MSTTPLSDAAIERFPDFAQAVRNRLERGRRDYGDDSFRRAPEEILQELAQEAEDLAGWGFVLWARIQAVLGRYAEARPSAAVPHE